MVLLTFPGFRAAFSPSGVDGDGYPTWPIDKVRITGFNAGFTGIPRPVTTFSTGLVISCNGQASDGGAAFDWYLSQRTDDPARQYLAMRQRTDAQSGTVLLTTTPTGRAAVGMAMANSPINEDQATRLFRDVTLYVRRVPDGAIQLVQVLPYTLASATP